MPNYPINPMPKPYCQKVLPLVYDDSLSYYEVLCKLTRKIDEIISTFNGGDVAFDRNAILYFDNAKAMAESKDLISGDLVKTSGYYSSGDGGGALYKITDLKPTTFSEELSNGLYAVLLPISGFVNVKQCGATGNGVTNDTVAFNNAVLASSSGIIVPDGYYIINGVNVVNAIGCGTNTKISGTFHVGTGGNISGINFINCNPAISVQGSNVKITDCNFDKNNVDININGVICKINNCYFIHHSSSIVINNTNNIDSGDHVITGCTWDGGEFRNNACITLQSGGGLYVANCKFLNSTYGIVENVQALATSILQVCNSSFESIDLDAIICINTAEAFSKVIIGNNEFMGGGININNITHITITSNIIDTPNKNAIVLRNVNYATICNNTSLFNLHFCDGSNINNAIMKNNSAVNQLYLHGGNNGHVEVISTVTIEEAGIIAIPNGICTLEVVGGSSYAKIAFPSLKGEHTDDLTIANGGISGNAGTYTVIYRGL